MIKYLQHISVIFLLLTSTSASGQSSDDAPEIYSLGNCPLKNTEVIEDCKIAYRTIGTLAADKSNVMIVPSWLGGTAQDFISSGYAGSGKMADSDKYYIILVEAFGNGNSSSPSNSASQSNENFPQFTIEDIVDAQYRLVSEHLGIDHVSAIVGVSLGASQTYQWMSKYPNFMDKAVIITGTPQPTTSDKLSYRLAIDAVSGLLKLNDNGEAARNFAIRFETHMAWTSAWFSKNIETEDYAAFEQARLNDTRLNPYDYKAQTTALLNGDITSVDDDDLSKTSMRLKMPFLTLYHDRDGYINPAPSITLATLSGQPLIRLGGDCGHYAPDCEMATMAKAVHDFLISPAN